MEQQMRRPRFKHTTNLKERPEEKAQRLRMEARGTPPGVERDKLIRQARQAETAAHIQQWLTSPGLRTPK
jgi:hypothetical protein